MKAPLFIRPLTRDEQQALQAGLGSPSPFTQRRCRMLLANADGRTATNIAALLGCAQQTVLNALNAFAAEGLECLVEKSHCPKRPHALIAASSAEKIRAIVRQHPREFGKPAHRWTYAAVAEVAYEQGLSERAVSDETIRQLVLRLGMDWKRDARCVAR
jgi:transposase